MPQSLSPSDPRAEDIISGHHGGHGPPGDIISGQASGLMAAPGYGQVVANTQVHSASYSVGEPSPEVQSRHTPSAIRSEGESTVYMCTVDKTGFVTGDAWSHAMEYEDEFAWSVQQFDNRLESAVVGDGRLSQDYDDIDYTSGNLVSFHTSLAR